MKFNKMYKKKDQEEKMSHYKIKYFIIILYIYLVNYK
jgi:hypothetical protein